MIKKILFLFIFLPIMILGQNKVLTHFYFDNDNQGQNTFKYYVGYNRDITDNFQLGIMNGFRNYVMPQFNDNYADERLTTVYSPFDNLTVHGNVSFLFSKNWSPIFYDGVVSYSPIDLLYFEGYIEHESVGSPLSNSVQYISTFEGGSVDINFTKSFTFVVGLANNSITNSNSKLYQTYRAVYTLPFEWVYVDAKAKIMTGGTYSQYYFSPTTFDQYSGGVGISTDLFSDNYYMRFYAGGGIQTIDGESKTLYVSNFRISADFTPRISGYLSFGITNSVNNLHQAYLYDYGEFQLSYEF